MILNPTVVKTSAWSIGRIAPEDKKVVSGLINLLTHESEEVRKSASWGLSRIELGINPLIEVLKGDSVLSLIAASEALAMIGPYAQNAVKDLANLLSHEDSSVRVSAVSALEAMGPEAGEVTDILISALEDSNRDVGWKASETLRKINTPKALEAWSRYSGKPQDSISSLIETLKHQDREKRVEAIKTLGQLKADDAVNA